MPTAAIYPLEFIMVCDPPPLLMKFGMRPEFNVTNPSLGATFVRATDTLVSPAPLPENVPT